MAAVSDKPRPAPRSQSARSPSSVSASSSSEARSASRTSASCPPPVALAKSAHHSGLVMLPTPSASSRRVSTANWAGSMRSPSSELKPFCRSRSDSTPSWSMSHSAKKVAGCTRFLRSTAATLCRTASSCTSWAWSSVWKTRATGAARQSRRSRRRHARTASNQRTRVSGRLSCTARSVAVTSRGVKLTSQSKSRKHWRAASACWSDSSAAHPALASNSSSPCRRASAAPPSNSGCSRACSPCSSARTPSASSSETASR
mmetsp:Transcript_17773/g.56148  ORF Transcript_17773/g.56148 Transcript_17773/m.56148 type:complete len:259 (+) Transcript_17773:1090-1866(+)